jgi:hypothetical protein
MLSRLALIIPLAFAACSTSPAGRWAGRVGDPCPGTALLSVGRGQAAFVRDDGAQVLRGTVTPDGQVSARLETRGADKKPFVQSFNGRVRGDTATGTYASPRCTAAPVTLHTG